MKKRLLSLFVAVAMLVSLLPNIALAATTPVIAVSDANLDAGESATVNVSISGAGNIAFSSIYLELVADEGITISSVILSEAASSKGFVLTKVGTCYQIDGDTFAGTVAGDIVLLNVTISVADNAENKDYSVEARPAGNQAGNIKDDMLATVNCNFTAGTITVGSAGEGGEGGSDASTEDYTAAIGSTANNVTRGDNVNVTVTVTGTYNAAELELSYDNSIMNYTGITATTNGEIAVDSITDGKLYIVDKGTEKAGNTYTLTFETTTVGNGNVTLDSAAFGTSEAAQTSNLTDATVSVSSVAVTVNAKTFAVTFPKDTVTGGELFSSDETPTEGTNFVFTAANNHYTYSKVVVKVGTDENSATEVVGITGNQANGWTVPGASITGNIYVTATVTGVSYGVTYNYQDENGQTQTGAAADAAYGTDYTYTMPNGVAPSGATDGFHYEVDTITVGGADIDNNSYTQNVSGKTVTVYGRAITGDVVITLKKVTDEANSWAVSVEADPSIAAAEYSYNATVAKDGKATLTIIPATGYTYTVTAKNTNDGATVELTQNGNEYTTTNGVTKNITFVIERTVTTDGVFSTKLYLEGGMGTGSQNMYLVLMSTNLGDKHYTCNGKAMYWSAKYNANCYLVIADTAPVAGSLTFAIANGEAETVDYDGDVNETNVVDANDAQLAYDMYNKQYKTITDNVSVLKFLEADMAGEDYKLDVNDAAAIVQLVLARMSGATNS